MKTILDGFTLAEVLITLAVIGVIASVTLPALNSNVQKQQVGPALAKAVNTLENANRLLLAENNARTLYETGGERYLNSLPNVVWKEKDVTKLKTLGSLNFSRKLTEKVCNTTKDGIQFCANNAAYKAGFGEYVVTEQMTAFTRNIDIFIDVNGDKAPNDEGVDVFRFKIDNDGSVVAYGSREYIQRYHNGTSSYTWENGGCDSNKVRPKRPGTCGGSIVDNGFKVIY